MPEPRHPWLPVARWEFVRLVRRKDFLISILTTPALAFGVAFLMMMIDRDADHKVAVARVDEAGQVAARGPEALPALRGFRWLDPGAAGADTSALRAAIRDKLFDAALVVHERETAQWSADLVTRREPPRWARDLREHVRATSRKERALGMGLTDAQVKALDDSLVFRSLVTTATRSGSRMGDFLVTFIMLMLMATVLITSMSYMMVGISGEKQARVTEVVVSAVSAQAWMDGKIVAFTGIGLLTGVVWAASLLLVSGPLAFHVPTSVNVVNMALTALFASLGLYLYNALISALMASAQSMQSASKWQGNFLMLPFIPFFFLGALLDNPDSTLMAVLSQVPLFSPVMIPSRLVVGAVQGWEVALALVLLVFGCAFMRLVAGRVFRIGMLMYGKDMTLPELIRWARVR